MALSLQQLLKRLGSSETATDTPMANLVSGYRDRVIGTSPQEYRGVFGQAYKNLGQPNVNEDVMIAGTRDLTDAFIERYHSKTGQFPDEAQITEFVSGNLTPRFAEQYVTGGIPNRAAVTSQIVDPFLEEKGVTAPTDQGYEKTLNDKYAELYSRGKEQVTQDVTDAYGQSKNTVVQDLAAQGMLGNPNSRLTLDKLEAEKGRSLGRALSELSAEQARGGIDVAQTIQGINEKERRAREDARRFNKNFQEDQYRYGNEQGLRREEMGLADALGRAEAGASGPGALDWANLGVKVGGLALAPFTAGASIPASSVLAETMSAAKGLGASMRRKKPTGFDYASKSTTSGYGF